MRDLGTQYIPRAAVAPPDAKFWLQLKDLKNETPGSDGTFSGEFSKRWKEIDLYELGVELVKQYITHRPVENGDQSTENDDQQRTQLEVVGIHAKSGAFLNAARAMI